MWKDISSFQLPPLPSYIFSSALLSDQMSLGRIYLIGIIEFKDVKRKQKIFAEFQPQIIVSEVKVTGSDVTDNQCNPLCRGESYKILFPQTSFMAVTAYQNQQVRDNTKYHLYRRY